MTVHHDVFARANEWALEFSRLRLLIDVDARRGRVKHDGSLRWVNSLEHLIAIVSYRAELSHDLWSLLHATEASGTEHGLLLLFFAAVIIFQRHILLRRITLVHGSAHKLLVAVDRHDCRHITRCLHIRVSS